MKSAVKPAPVQRVGTQLLGTVLCWEQISYRRWLAWVGATRLTLEIRLVKLNGQRRWYVSEYLGIRTFSGSFDNTLDAQLYAEHLARSVLRTDDLRGFARSKPRRLVKTAKTA